MTTTAPSHAARRCIHGFALSLALAALAFAPSAVSNVYNPNMAGLPGDIQFSAGGTEPIKVFNAHSMEFDQRAMAFGEEAEFNVLAMAELSASGATCGSFALKVTRYQNYRLVWRGNGQEKVILQRGGLVADSGRPYVGVFFAPGNKLEIRTYNRATAFNQYGEPIAGGVINAWTAASIAVPANRFSLEKNGLWTVDAAGQKRAWMTGASGC